jgi:hypothetical protein
MVKPKFNTTGLKATHRSKKTGFNRVLSAIRKVELGVAQFLVRFCLCYISTTLLLQYTIQQSTCLLMTHHFCRSLGKSCRTALNVNKTKYMLFSRRRVDVKMHEALSIDSEQLEEVNSMKYLGVQIDNKLNFKVQFSSDYLFQYYFFKIITS